MSKQIPHSISIPHLLRTSLLLVSGMIAFLFLMKLVGLDTIPELHYLNILILFFGVRNVLQHRQTVEGEKVGIHVAVILGFVTSLVSSFFFSLFLFMYLDLSPSFMALLQNTEPLGNYLAPAACAFITFLEGITAGTILAIPALVTLKSKSHEEVQAKHIGQLAN